LNSGHALRNSRIGTSILILLATGPSQQRLIRHIQFLRKVFWQHVDVFLFKHSSCVAGYHALAPQILIRLASFGWRFRVLDRLHLRFHKFSKGPISLLGIEDVPEEVEMGGVPDSGRQELQSDLTSCSAAQRDR
jgi:hypothetical protein